MIVPANIRLAGGVGRKVGQQGVCGYHSSPVLHAFMEAGKKCSRYMFSKGQDQLF